MTGIQFLVGVATFIFSTAPKQALGLIQHPPSSQSLRFHGAIPPFPRTFQSMKFNEA